MGSIEKLYNPLLKLVGTKDGLDIIENSEGKQRAFLAKLDSITILLYGNDSRQIDKENCSSNELYQHQKQDINLSLLEVNDHSKPQIKILQSILKRCTLSSLSLEIKRFYFAQSMPD